MYYIYLKQFGNNYINYRCLQNSLGNNTNFIQEMNSSMFKKRKLLKDLLKNTLHVPIKISLFDFRIIVIYYCNILLFRNLLVILELKRNSIYKLKSLKI